VSRYSLSHLADGALLLSLATLVAHDRNTTAELLAHLAEVDARRLYAPAGYPTMFSYCVGKLGFSEDVAFKRIRSARAARTFPAILDAVADGRLHVAAIVLLSPYLNLDPQIASELLAAAQHKTKRQVEKLLAERFPQPDMPTSVRAVIASPPPNAIEQVAPSSDASRGPSVGLVAPGPPVPSDEANGAPGMEPVSADSVAHFAAKQPTPPSPALPPGRTTPLSPERYALQFTVSRETHERLRRVQDLLASAVTSADIPDVFDRALKMLEQALERRRFAATENPRKCRGCSDARHVMADVQREVWERDGGQCTYVSDDGHRCEARRWLEYDHRTPVARGGASTVENLRLRCRAHNQLEAERTFGAGFMAGKREHAGHRTREAIA